MSKRARGNPRGHNHGRADYCNNTRYKRSKPGAPTDRHCVHPTSTGKMKCGQCNNYNSGVRRGACNDCSFDRFRLATGPEAKFEQRLEGLHRWSRAKELATGTNTSIIVNVARQLFGGNTTVAKEGSVRKNTATQDSDLDLMVRLPQSRRDAATLWFFVRLLGCWEPGLVTLVTRTLEAQVKVSADGRRLANARRDLLPLSRPMSKHEHQRLRDALAAHADVFASVTVAKHAIKVVPANGGAETDVVAHRYHSDFTFSCRSSHCKDMCARMRHTHALHARMLVPVQAPCSRNVWPDGWCMFAWPW